MVERIIVYAVIALLSFSAGIALGIWIGEGRVDARHANL